MSTLASILRSDCCSGCGACAYVAADRIRMDYSADGFLRPVVNGELSADEEKRVARTCPGILLDVQASAAIDHPIWGPVAVARTGHATDTGLRHHASSGGVISALLTHLLGTGKISFVVQTAASPLLPTCNEAVVSVSADDIAAAAGSRYAPSAPVEKLRHYLDRPGNFAFVGKPCDVAAVRMLIKEDPALAARIPFLISFFCAGVPSTRGAKAILHELGVAEQDLRSFRYRGDGWPGFATAETADGKLHRMNYEASWGNILSKHVQFRCKICPDGSGGFADIVCGDAWESDARGYPKFTEGDGRSLILTRTSVGEELCREAERAGAIATASLDIAEVEVMQPSQARRKRLVLSRLWAMRLAGRRLPRFHGLHLIPAARSAGLYANARSFLGLCRRLAMGRTVR